MNTLERYLMDENESLPYDYFGQAAFDLTQACRAKMDEREVPIPDP
jgi:hypothetical protein